MRQAIRQLTKITHNANYVCLNASYFVEMRFTIYVCRDAELGFAKIQQITFAKKQITIAEKEITIAKTRNYPRRNAKYVCRKLNCDRRNAK